MSISQVSIYGEDPVLKELNLKINKRLDLAHNEKNSLFSLYTYIKGKTYSDTYDGLKDKLEDRLDFSYNVSGIITLLVLIRSEMDQHIRKIEVLHLTQRLNNAIKLLTDDITAYKSIAFSISAELTAIKELIAVKFPNQRFNITQ